MVVLSLLLALLPGGDAAHADPRPPNQTASQAKLCADWSHRSETYSNAATSSVVSHFESTTFKKAISDIPELAKMSGKELLDFFTQNVRDIPLIVTFDIEHWDDIVGPGHLFNKWQLERNGVSFAPNQLKLADYAERTLADFPAIKQLTKPTADEADTRPLYFAVNLWKKSNGNPMYGNTHFVVYPERHPFCLLAPSDTGWWYKACIERDPKAGDCNCAAYHNPAQAMGTYAHFHHVILEHTTFYKYGVEKLFRRFWNNSKESVPHGGQDNFYYECDMAAAFWVPEHVWYTILDFGLLWGQSHAAKLQTWHAAKHRPITWGGDPDRMLLDAKVGVFGGANITAKHKSTFEHFWTTGSKSQFHSIFSSMPAILHFYFMRSVDCGGHSCGRNCMYMGTNGDRDCIYTGYK